MSFWRADAASGTTGQAGQSASVSVPGGGRTYRPIRGWMVLAAILLIGAGVLWATASRATASPTNSDGSLKCQACHSNPNFQELHLADGTRLATAQSAILCGECHAKRYQAWVSGTHGFAGYKEGSPAGEVPGSTNCTTCHDPHEPRIALKDITKPHPEPVPAPPALPKDLAMIMAISMAVVGGGFLLALGNRGRQ